MVKKLPASAGDVGSVPASRRSPGEKMATHSSILAWEIPWTGEPCGLQSMGSQKSQRLTTATALFPPSPHLRECSHPHHRAPLILCLHHKTDTERNREDRRKDGAYTRGKGQPALCLSRATFFVSSSPSKSVLQNLNSRSRFLRNTASPSCSLCILKCTC